VREILLGLVAVGMAVGVAVGRQSERVRRAYKDWGTAKTALTKSKGIAMTELRRIVAVGLTIVVILLIIFVATFRLTGSSP